MPSTLSVCEYDNQLELENLERIQLVGRITHHLLVQSRCFAIFLQCVRLQMFTDFKLDTFMVYLRSQFRHWKRSILTGQLRTPHPILGQ